MHTLDTSGKPDWEHELRLTVPDIARNRATALRSVRIDNTAPKLVAAVAVDSTHVDVTFSEELAAQVQPIRFTGYDLSATSHMPWEGRVPASRTPPQGGSVGVFDAPGVRVTLLCVHKSYGRLLPVGRGPHSLEPGRQHQPGKPDNVGSETSQQLYAEACSIMPGGVNSPVRAMRAVGREPVFIERGQGSRMWDVDGVEYIDYLGSWGPMILGHCHPAVTSALHREVDRGTSFGTCIPLEVEMARRVVEAVPSVDMVRMTSSGTEATMSALRVARGFTGRPRIVKFIGCYHGHGDSLLVHAGSGVATFGLPDSPGVTCGTAQDTVALPFNDLGAVEEAFAEVGEEIAAVIVEPVAGNMGCVPPVPLFLEGLRVVTSRHKSLLIFDEVMTGFRLAYGGAQERFGVTPDMTTLGKVIGAGLPVGAFGGRLEIMEQVAPVGNIYQAGTLSGNPLAMAAGIAALDFLRDSDAYDQLEARGAELEEGLRQAAQQAGVAACVQRVGSMMTMFFNEGPVTDFASAKRSDTERYASFYRGMLERGVYLAPSQFECAFLSVAHGREDIDRTVAAAAEVLGKLPPPKS